MKTRFISAAITLFILFMFSACTDEKTWDESENYSQENVDTLMQKYAIDEAESRMAICNDGTPAVFYHSKGFGEHEKDWLVFLEGGGGCSNEESCKAQWKTENHKMSSKSYKSTASRGGILSPSPEINPDFYMYNKVLVPFCSSDMWAGDAKVTFEDTSLEFRGKSVIKALFEDLQNEEIFPENSMSDANQVLFTGSSAGGTGVFNNADFVADLLPENIDYKVIVDAAYRVILPNFSTNQIYDYSESMSFHKPIPDESCKAAKKANYGDCFELPSLYPYIESPIFVIMDKTDKKMLEHLGLTKSGVAESPEQKAYLEEFIDKTESSFAETVEHGFLYSAYSHTSITGELFNNIQIDGHSLREVIANWALNKTGPTKVY